MTSGLHNDALHKVRHEVHPHCVICDLANPKGLHIDYVISTDKQEVWASFFCDGAYEGYPGIMHGGVISALCDGAMGNCLFAHGITAVTIEITTRFRHPVATGEYAVIRARIMRTALPLIFLEADIVQYGQVKATAKGKFCDQPQYRQDLELPR